jgi:hypothetical protein
MTRQSNDHLFQRFGDLDYPVEGTDVTGAQLFSAFDPGRDALLDLFEAAINQELAHDTSAVQTTSPWYACVSGTPLANAMPVETKLREAPRRSLFRGARYTFPLLCLYRQRSEHDEATLGRERITTFWGLDYILGPLVSDDYAKLGAALHAARTIIRLVIRRGFHLAYDSGSKQFGAGNGHFSTIQIVEDAEGPATFGLEGPSARGLEQDDLELFTLHMMLRTTELEDALDPVAEASPFDGADIRIGIGGSDGTLPDAIEANTTVEQQPPYGKPEGG